MPTSLIAPLVMGGISYGANKLLAPKPGSATAGLSKANFTPPGLNAGGISAGFGPGGYGVTASPERAAAVGGVSSTFGANADALAALRSSVAPGMSTFRNALEEGRMTRLQQLEDARKGSIGNLRDNLARRRVLGSSFGQDAISRADSEFARQKDQVTADAAIQEANTYLQEVEKTHQLLQEEFSARRSVFQTGLDEMNLEANLAAGLTGKATDVLGKNAQVEAMLNAQEQAGQGKLVGQLIQPIAAAAGKSAGGFFTGGGGSTFSGNGSQASMGGGFGGAAFG